MTPKSSLFQTSFSTTLLRSAALAVALIVQTSPARAEVITLICQDTERGSFTLRVDYDQKSIAWLLSDGTVRLSSAATITESDVQWGDWSSFDNWHGVLNRLSGEALMHVPAKPIYSMRGPCRRATKKF